MGLRRRDGIALRTLEVVLGRKTEAMIRGMVGCVRGDIGIMGDREANADEEEAALVGRTTLLAQRRLSEESVREVKGWGFMGLGVVESTSASEADCSRSFGCLGIVRRSFTVLDSRCLSMMLDCCPRQGL